MLYIILVKGFCPIKIKRLLNFLMDSVLIFWWQGAGSLCRFQCWMQGNAVQGFEIVPFCCSRQFICHVNLFHYIQFFKITLFYKALFVFHSYLITYTSWLLILLFPFPFSTYVKQLYFNQIGLITPKIKPKQSLVVHIQSLCFQ